MLGAGVGDPFANLSPSSASPPSTPRRRRKAPRRPYPAFHVSRGFARIHHCGHKLEKVAGSGGCDGPLAPMQWVAHVLHRRRDHVTVATPECQVALPVGEPRMTATLPLIRSNPDGPYHRTFGRWRRLPTTNVLGRYRSQPGRQASTGTQKPSGGLRLLPAPFARRTAAPDRPQIARDSAGCGSVIRACFR